jgi:senataxin
VAAAASAQSLRNQAEADLAVALLRELRGELARTANAAGGEGGVPPPARTLTIGVITPYRRQVETLRATFGALAGPDAATRVTIETVDAFQGKEVDVAILSCVRARAPGGGAPGVAADAALHRSVGFVADVRRLNVAITRARRALWILGSAATLSASPVWAALIQDAEARKCVVWDACAAELFPHQFGGGRGVVVQQQQRRAYGGAAGPY